MAISGMSPDYKVGYVFNQISLAYAMENFSQPTVDQVR